MDWIEEFFDMLFPLDRSRQKIDEAYMLKGQHLPEKVYKYRSVDDYSLKNLEEDTVWLADPETLNDPYECHHFVDHRRIANSSVADSALLREQLKTLFPGKIPDHVLDNLKGSHDPILDIMPYLMPDTPEEQLLSMKVNIVAAFENLMESNRDEVVKGFKSAFVLCSFSQRVDSTLMWSHYADFHRGFCIEYNVKSAPQGYFSRFMYPVRYTDVPFDATENFRRVDTDEFNNLYLNLAGLTKATDWSYEKEWRLLFTNGVLKGAQAYKVPRPTKVYLGSHISDKNKAEIMRICQFKGIPVEYMQHARNAFKMTSIPIDN